MRGFIEVEGLMMDTPSSIGYPVTIAVDDISSFADMSALPEIYGDELPAKGTKTAIVFKSMDQPLYTSADYETVKQLVRAAAC